LEESRTQLTEFIHKTGIATWYYDLKNENMFATVNENAEYNRLWRWDWRCRALVVQ